MFKLIATFLGSTAPDESSIPRTRRQREMDDYLAESVDRCDLERRERELSRRGYYI